MSNLKDELLRLLREDESFRMEVLRMLGIMDVNVALSQLTDSVNKLTKSIEDLREEIRKLWEENHRIWEEIQKMREDIRELREENQKIWEEIRKIWEEIHGLRKSHEDLIRIVKGVLKDLGGLSRTVGKLVEQNIRHYLPAWIRETYGITVDRVRRLKVNNIAEFDGYVETEDKVLLMEIKTTLRTRDIKDMTEKIEKYRAQAPSGKTIIPMIIYTIEGEGPEKLINTAKLHGIMLIKHYGEYEFELINQ